MPSITCITYPLKNASGLNLSNIFVVVQDSWRHRISGFFLLQNSAMLRKSVSLLNKPFILYDIIINVLTSIKLYFVKFAAPIVCALTEP